MHFHDTNSSLAALRAMVLEEHPEAAADRAIKAVSYTHLKIAPKHDTKTLYPPVPVVTAEMGGFSLIGGTMPRMSKKRKLELSFVLNDRGRVAYNDLCRKCQHKCKQSFRAVVIDCPHYLSKRARCV